jgi:SAM-dependent methyltransferase
MIKGPIFIGRSWQEYLKMFSLEGMIKDRSLCEMKILDCAAGASTLTAHLADKGVNIRAVDFLYDLEPAEIGEKCHEHLKLLVNNISKIENAFDWTFFTSLDGLRDHRTETCKHFTRDYQNNRERYIPADITALPFNDNEFDLVICSHLLFIYDYRLDYDFHLNSVNEMLRVSKKELRIYPLVKHHQQKSLFVEDIFRDLEDEVYVDLVKVDYQFRKGANEMLILRK